MREKIEEFLKKASEASDSKDAVKFTDAAFNVALVMEKLQDIEISAKNQEKSKKLGENVIGFTVPDQDSDDCEDSGNVQ